MWHAMRGWDGRGPGDRARRRGGRRTSAWPRYRDVAVAVHQRDTRPGRPAPAGRCAVHRGGSGDPVARSLVTRQAAEVCVMAAAAMRQLGMTPAGAPVVLGRRPARVARSPAARRGRPPARGSRARLRRARARRAAGGGRRPPGARLRRSAHHAEAAAPRLLPPRPCLRYTDFGGDKGDKSGGFWTRTRYTLPPPSARRKSCRVIGDVDDRARPTFRKCRASAGRCPRVRR